MTSLPSADSFASPVDDYAPGVLQSTCDATPKPGVLAFSKLVLSAVGGKNGRISAVCPEPGAKPCEHAEGRAWDWMVLAANPEDAARADAVIAWLLSSDSAGHANAMFRRAGLQYIIWNNRIWSVRTKDWQPYTGPNPHIDHVHFSFGWDGALGKTTLYGGGDVTPTPPPAPPGPGPAPVEPVSRGARMAGLLVGVVAGAVVGSAIVRRTWR